EVVVCDARRNRLITEGSKGDKADARKLAELLRTGMVRSVWHGRQTTRGLKEMVRSYETFAIDTRRTMLRIKALYRSRGIVTTGTGVYQVKQREHWLKQLTEVAQITVICLFVDGASVVPVKIGRWQEIEGTFVYTFRDSGNTDKWHSRFF